MDMPITNSPAAVVAVPGALGAELDQRARAPWIRSPGYDWIFFLGGVVLIGFVILMYYVVRPFETNLLQLGTYSQWINIVVPVLLGGPHIWVSFTRNYMDAEFRMRHPRLLRIAPHAIFVGILILTTMPREIGVPVLMNVVFYSALFHGLSQLTHIAIKYDRNVRPEAARMAEMVLNGVLVFCGPLAYVCHAIGRTEFRFVGVPIAPVLSHPLIVGAFTVAFCAAAAIYLGQCAADLVRGRFNVPRFLTIAITQVAFVILVEVGNADITFQAYNAWHSFQALGLYWAANNARWRARRLFGPAVKLGADGTLLRAYLSGVAFALALGVLVIGLSYLTMTGTMADLSVSPWYFLLPVTALLFHHFMDYFTFFRRGAFDY
jgi:hypothetical protein